jgi:hypothetical protein
VKFNRDLLQEAFATFTAGSMFLTIAFVIVVSLRWRRDGGPQKQGGHLRSRKSRRTRHG